jgi:uncharacterized membrane protein YqjE
MKYSTALKQSKGSVRFLLVAAPCIWALYIFWIRYWVVAAFAAFMSLYLLMDLWNIWKIKKAAKEDPELLKKKVPGT